MEHPAGASDDGALRVDFGRRLRLEYHGSRITSDAGLLADRDLDDALGLTDLAAGVLSDGRRGRNTRHLLAGLLRQSVFGRLAGYVGEGAADIGRWSNVKGPCAVSMLREHSVILDVNDAERLAHDPAMRAVVGRQDLDRAAASTSQMGRFEAAWLTSDANLTALSDLSGVGMGGLPGGPTVAAWLDGRLS